MQKAKETVWIVDYFSMFHNRIYGSKRERLTQQRDEIKRYMYICGKCHDIFCGVLRFYVA